MSRATFECNYIAVEGVIGVGKTSFAAMLAERLGAIVLNEEVLENPFLTDFYRNRKRYAFSCQIYFLLSRFQQQQQLQTRDLFAQRIVADYLFAKDQLFADLNLSPEELSLYNQVVTSLNVEAPVPDLVIYLQASVDALMDRITRRGVAIERNIDRAYLENLTDAYARFFHEYNDGPLLIVNASQIDPINNAADYEQLFEQIEKTTGGRHFFNPVAAALA